MQNGRAAQKVKQSRQIEKDIERFLENGGEIKQATLEDCKFYRDRKKKGPKTPPPLVIKKQTQQIINARHRWRIGHTDP